MNSCDVGEFVAMLVSLVIIAPFFWVVLADILAQKRSERRIKEHKNGL